MKKLPTIRRGLFFEEFEIGHVFTTPARTITEADIVAFAGISGDYNLIHTDSTYAKTTTFGQRVAHGLLSLSVVSGLAVRSGFMEGTVLAFREVNKWKFSLPVFIGDTIHAQIEVVETKSLPRLGGGAVNLLFRVKNQDDQTVMRGIFNLLIQSENDGEQNS
ncbi:MAG: dehydratase [Chloroflexi bacterium]|nr:dehydratase [Chloroflexota bacterium]